MDDRNRTLIRPSVYAYDDPVRFVEDAFRWRKQQDPAISVRKAAQEAGWDSPAVLAGILSRKRSIKLKHAPFLARAIALDPSEMLYFKTLIQRAGAQSLEEREMFELLLNQLSPRDDSGTLRSEEPELFSHWTHTAILSLARLGGCRADAEFIRARLKFPVAIEQVRATLELLQRIGLLSVDGEGMLKPIPQHVTTRTDVSHRGAQEYFRQVSALAAEAVPTPLDQREFQCFSLGIHQRDLPAFKQLIRSFRSQSEKLASGEKDRVYQMNLQFFPLTSD